MDCPITLAMSLIPGLLLQYFTIYGYARSKMTDAGFRDLISSSLTCRVSDGEGCGKSMDAFLTRCFYQSVSAFTQLTALIQHTELSPPGWQQMSRILLMSCPLGRWFEDVPGTTYPAAC